MKGKLVIYKFLGPEDAREFVVDGRSVRVERGQTIDVPEKVGKTLGPAFKKAPAKPAASSKTRKAPAKPAAAPQTNKESI